jgi:hypothetical protein
VGNAVYFADWRGVKCALSFWNQQLKIYPDFVRDDEENCVADAVFQDVAIKNCPAGLVLI